MRGRTLAILVHANVKRAAQWHQNIPWTIMEWGCAAAGEMGEAANVAKKIRRAQQNLNNRMPGTAEEQIAKLRPELLEEIADTMMYLFLLADAAGYNGDDLEEAFVNKFNKVSVELGFPERL